MENVLLFCDGSVNPKTKTGCGAYLLITEENISIEPAINLKIFENTSSTKLELEILLWALNEIKEKYRRIKVYTDSQNIVGLLDRRSKLEQNNFFTAGHKKLKNHELYKEFYHLIDTLDFEINKIRGHKPGSQKNKIDELFTLVDRAARKGLRDNKD